MIFSAAKYHILQGDSKVILNDKIKMKQIKITPSKKTTYTNIEDSVNLTHYQEYSTSDDFRENLQTIIQWSSDLKFIASTFNNYLWKKLFDDNLALPEINDTFFTKLFNTVAGKKNAPYQEIFRRKAA